MARTTPDPDMAARLRLAREARGYRSALQAAEAFGFNRNTYGQHESATRGMSKEAERYAAAYRVPLAWLLTGSGPSGLPDKVSDAPPLSARLEVDAAMLHDAVSFVLRAEDVPRHRAELVASIFVEAIAKPPLPALGNDVRLSFRSRFEDRLSIVGASPASE